MAVTSGGRHDFEPLPKFKVQEFQPQGIHDDFNDDASGVARSVVVPAVAGHPGPATLYKFRLAIPQSGYVLHAAAWAHVIGQVEVGPPREVEGRGFNLERNCANGIAQRRQDALRDELTTGEVAVAGRRGGAWVVEVVEHPHPEVYVAGFGVGQGATQRGLCQQVVEHHRAGEQHDGQRDAQEDRQFHAEGRHESSPRQHITQVEDGGHAGLLRLS